MMDRRELAAYKPTQGLARRLQSIIDHGSVECLEEALGIMRTHLSRREFSAEQPLDPRARDALLPMIVQAEAVLVGMFPVGYERMIHAGMRGFASQVMRCAATEASDRLCTADAQDDDDRARILENFASSLVCRNAITARAIARLPRARDPKAARSNRAG